MKHASVINESIYFSLKLAGKGQRNSGKIILKQIINTHDISLLIRFAPGAITGMNPGSNEMLAERLEAPQQDLCPV
jgi:hypothetical protein